MGKFDFESVDGTRVRGWRNDGAGVPVVISNGLGAAPETWPTLCRRDSGFQVCSWYHRGTGGGARPHDRSRVHIDDHVGDLLALMDHEGIERAVVACWSMGVSVGFEFARQHPGRVAGLMAVAGVPGGMFQAMFGLMRVPRAIRHDSGVAAARVLRAAGRALNVLVRTVPLNATTARVINHSGFVLPAATPERLVPALREYRTHDFRWYFTLALGVQDHAPIDLAAFDMPVTMVAGRYDVLTFLGDMVEAASRIPHAEIKILPGSHFLPLEFPDEIAGWVGELADRSDLR
jgi:pimeloyl-ACP methyl ester carboxylesterase